MYLKYILLSEIFVELLASLFDGQNNASRHGLPLLTVAEKEWIGLAVYRLLGWTDRLFPGGDV